MEGKQYNIQWQDLDFFIIIDNDINSDMFNQDR